MHGWRYAPGIDRARATMKLQRCGALSQTCRRQGLRTHCACLPGKLLLRSSQPLQRQWGTLTWAGWLTELPYLQRAAQCEQPFRAGDYKLVAGQTLRQSPGCRLARHAWAAAALLLAAGPRLTGAVYNNSVFNKGNYYPVPWWAVASSDVPAIASNALILRQNTITPNEFAQNVVLGIANNQRNDVRPAGGLCCSRRHSSKAGN